MGITPRIWVWLLSHWQHIPNQSKSEYPHPKITHKSVNKCGAAAEHCPHYNKGARLRVQILFKDVRFRVVAWVRAVLDW